MVKKSHPEASAEGFTQASTPTPSEAIASEGFDVAVYEVGFHLIPTVPEADVSAAMDRVRGQIERMGGSLIAEESPKRIQFAYRIERSVAGKREKFTEGYFGWVKFEAGADAVQSLEASLRGDREVLRFIIIHTSREAVAPQRAVFSSDRLEGQTIEKPAAAVPEKRAEVSDEAIEKSLESLVSQ